MKTNRIAFALMLILAAAGVFAEDSANDKVVKVEPIKVCMINDASMANEQIPVAIDGKTYYGCCPMCKDRLANDAAKRVAVDPVSGKTVDKAKAVIGAAEDGAVVYFESEKNLKKYNKQAAKK